MTKPVETPSERYFRRQSEIEILEMKVEERRRDINDELKNAQKKCKHVDDGGMISGSCTKCGLDLG